jgi:EAL domain-containing protein (putative c-di-GMP-specific phosphodiesterase class I)
VENAKQLDALRNLGCAHGQGYHLSRPVDSAKFEVLLGVGKVSPS